jgi:ATP-dependent exoDNAse (exonuclease V) beta subunit
VPESIAWSEAALELFDLRSHTAVEAGAGSGKTTCLVELATRLLSGEATGEPLDPSAVVAITFTEKAGEELAERLRESVAARARAAPPGPERRAWQSRLAGLDRLAAGTIHAFAAGLLREHALEAGVDPEFAQLDEEGAAAWRAEAARRAVVAALDAGRPAARELASLHGAGGARAGLAEIVAEVVRERASRGLAGQVALPPERGAEALAARDRLAAAAGELLAARAVAPTAAARAALDDFAAAWARLPPGDLRGALGAAGRDRLLGAAAAARGRGGGEPVAAARSGIQEAAAAFGALSAEALGREQAEELGRLVAEAEAAYAARKLQAPALDFDDLLLRLRDLLAGDAALLAELRGRIRALLLDEVQDVNPVQQEIADLLCAPGSPGRPGPPALLVAVGDPKQSIYRFRGADVAVFRRLVERMRSGEGRVLRLADNHRAGGAVLEVVNAVSARALQPLGHPASPFEIAFREEDRLRAVRPTALSPACEILEDAEAGSAAERRGREARAVAARIGALVSGAAGVALPGAVGEPGRRPRFADVALLFRRLTQVGDYERALRAAGIPYRLARGGGFFRAPEVRDLGELLQSLLDPSDAVAWAALLRSPLCGLTDGALVLLARGGFPTLARRDPGAAARELGEMLAAIPSPGPVPCGRVGDGGLAPAATDLPRLRRFLAAWQWLRDRRDRLALPDLLTEALERLDLEAALVAAPDGDRRRDNLRKALALARRFAAAGGTAQGFAGRLRQLASRPPREPEAELPAGDAVAVLTVHQAKGLEWPIVFVPDLGAAPRSDARKALLDAGGRLCAAWGDPASEEHAVTASLAAAREEERRAAAAESRRLLYVALTRARDYLVLSGAPVRRGDTWRQLVEAGLEGRPGLSRRIPLGEAGSLAVGPPLPAAPPPHLPEPAAAAPPRLAPPPPAPPVRVAVTDLVEWARCPTRHFLSRRLHLVERPGGAGAPDDDPDRATARGTLAHAALAALDLAAPPLERRAQLVACARRLGHDPSAPAARRVLADVTRFLESPGGLWLAAQARRGALRREVPFLLRLDGGPGCYLVGAIDALAEEDGAIRIVDFKYALPRREAAERYRLQLCAYALAASRAHPGRPVRAGLQFLRGRCDAVDLTPSAGDMLRLASEAPGLASALHRGSGEISPGALGRTRERCAAEACGFVYRCHPGARPGPRAMPRDPGAPASVDSD